MSNSCGRSLKACAMKVTKLGADGSPVVGSENAYVTNDLVTLTIGSEYADDDDFEVRGASGDVCLRYFAFGPLKNITFGLNLCSADPELHALLTGQQTLESGEAVGFPWPEIGVGQGCSGGTYYGVGLEVWTLHVGSDGSLDGSFPYLRWLFPKTFWRIADKNIENAPMAHNFDGFGIQNDQWLDGPANDWPVLSDRAGQWLPVATAPTPQCGYAAVSSS